MQAAGARLASLDLFSLHRFGPLSENSDCSCQRVTRQMVKRRKGAKDSGSLCTHLTRAKAMFEDKGPICAVSLRKEQRATSSKNPPRRDPRVFVDSVNGGAMAPSFIQVIPTKVPLA